eukprot:g17571.t1
MFVGQARTSCANKKAARTGMAVEGQADGHSEGRGQFTSDKIFEPEAEGSALIVFLTAGYGAGACHCLQLPICWDTTSLRGRSRTEVSFEDKKAKRCTTCSQKSPTDIMSAQREPWEGVHGEFIKLYYQHARRTDRVLLPHSGRVSDGVEDAIHLKKSAFDALPPAYEAQLEARRVYEHEKRNREWAEIANLGDENQNSEQPQLVEQLLGAPGVAPPPPTQRNNFFRSTARALRIGTDEDGKMAEDGAAAAWKAFFRTEQVAAVEGDPEAAGRCWAGVFSLSLAKLLYLGREDLDGLLQSYENDVPAQQQQHFWEDLDYDWRPRLLLHTFADGFAAELIKQLPWETALNSAWPVPDLLDEAQTLISDSAADRRAAGGGPGGASVFLERVNAFAEQLRFLDPAAESDVQQAESARSGETASGPTSLRSEALAVLLGGAAAGAGASSISASSTSASLPGSSAATGILEAAAAHLVLALFNQKDKAFVRDRLRSCSERLSEYHARFNTKNTSGDGAGGTTSGTTRSDAPLDRFLPSILLPLPLGPPPREDLPKTPRRGPAPQNMLFFPKLYLLLRVLDEGNAPRFRTEAVVIVGRLDRLQILQYYLHANLRSVGGASGFGAGCLDKVNFVVHNAIQLQQTFGKHVYDAPPVFGKKLAKFYSFARRSRNKHTVYVKIDDDVVFLSKNAIPDIAREKYFRQNDVSLVSGNVVNHAILSAVHNELGAVPDKYGPVINPEWDADDEKRRRRRKEVLLNKPATERDHMLDTAAEEDEAFRQSQMAKMRKGGQQVRDGVEEDKGGDDPADNIEAVGLNPWAPQIEKHPQGTCVWSRWECAEWVHRAFLHHYHAKTLDHAFGFWRYNFHLYGYGNPRPGVEGEVDFEIVPLQNSRWSINFFAFLQADLLGVDEARLSLDDESQLSYVQPWKRNRPSVAVGSALAVHFSYGKQERGLVDHTELLAAYRNLTFYDYY